jgi:ABC-type phosphonate transport system ATPase subunit
MDSNSTRIGLHQTLVQYLSTRYDDYLGNFYTRLKRRKNKQIAIVATARRLLVSISYMLKRQEPYDPLEVSA